MAKSKIVKNGQLYTGILDFTTNLNIPDVPPSNTASFGHPWKSYLTSHFSIGIHVSYGHCTSTHKYSTKVQDLPSKWSKSTSWVNVLCYIPSLENGNTQIK